MACSLSYDRCTSLTKRGENKNSCIIIIGYAPSLRPLEQPLHLKWTPWLIYPQCRTNYVVLSDCTQAEADIINIAIHVAVLDKVIYMLGTCIVESTICEVLGCVTLRALVHVIGEINLHISNDRLTRFQKRIIGCAASFYVILLTISHYLIVGDMTRSRGQGNLLRLWYSTSSVIWQIYIKTLLEFSTYSR